MRRLRPTIRRLLLAIPVLISVIILNFGLLHLAPGDAASVMAGEGGAATSEYTDMLRHKFGLDQSLPIQFWHYITTTLQFDEHGLRHP